MRAGALILSLAVLAGCGSSASPSASGSPSTQPGPPTPSEAASDAPSGPPSDTLEERLEATVDIEGADFPFVAFDSVWVVAGGPSHPAIVRVDPATNTIIADITVPGANCTGAVAGFDAIWACSNDGIVRIDPATNEVVTVIEVETFGQARLAAGAGSVWAFARLNSAIYPDALYRIDPTTNSVAATIDLGHTAGTMAFGFEALWVTSPDDGVLLRVDPLSNEVTSAVEDLAAPFQVTVGPDSLWVSLHGAVDETAGPGEPTVARIDPATGEVTASIVTGPIGREGGIHADGTSVWIRAVAPFLTVIDPATNQLIEVVTATKGPGDLVIGFGSVWAAGYNFNQLWRVSP
jgi:hypothetical protein